MNFKITIQPSNIEFTAVESESILNAALAAKINLPHGCKNGDCAACRCKMTSGEVELEPYNKMALSDEDLAAGFTLLCKSLAKSDVELDIPGFTNSFPIKNLPAKIEEIKKIGTVAIMKLKLPANQIFEFNAGQYIDIMFEGKNRSYSVANSPTHPGILELHIRYRQSGVFSEAVWNKLNVNQILRFKGPLGSFKLQNSNSPILMVCTGTGFAPIKAILESMLAQQNPRPVTLVWGNYIPEDFYLIELLNVWQKGLNLTVKLCANDRPSTDYYGGLVTDYVQAAFPDLAAYEVYACGNPAMIENLYNLAVNQLHLNKGAFYSDVFTPSI